jgi:glyoxylase-like metal-dependent hydrolase (beta-lactamase superfamily II)
MLKRIALVLVALLVLVVGAAAVALIRAHRAIDRETPPLPTLESIAAVAGVATIVDDPPVQLSVINTASQAMPRRAVLDTARDPHPDEPYVMSYPAFVLRWRDGRMLLIDAGMSRAAAVSFGKPIEWLGGAEAIVPHASIGEALGDATAQVRAIIFTHLHTDHVEGIAELCARMHKVRAPLNVAQAERPNYTTQPGLDALYDADCVGIERLGDGPLVPVVGFPGVFVIHAGGHTPGSQIILAFVQAADGAVHRYAFSGDIVNNRDGIMFDVPKPWLYRTFAVPESDARQAELRHFLKRLHDEGSFELVVSHDQHAIEAAGIPPWTPSAQPE